MKHYVRLDEYLKPVKSTILYPDFEGRYPDYDLNTDLMEVPELWFNNTEYLHWHQDDNELVFDLVQFNKDQAYHIAMQNRLQAYGSVEDQLDEIYHNINDWRTRIDLIKAMYPLPE